LDDGSIVGIKDEPSFFVIEPRKGVIQLGKRGPVKILVTAALSKASGNGEGRWWGESF
jgi:hypothetical protein